eukprot:scpid71289/ scgid6038/ 
MKIIESSIFEITSVQKLSLAKKLENITRLLTQTTNMHVLPDALGAKEYIVQKQKTTRHCGAGRRESAASRNGTLMSHCEHVLHNHEVIVNVCCTIMRSS